VSGAIRMTARARRVGPLWLSVLAALGAVTASARTAYAQQAEPSPFACRGEAQALMVGLDTDAIRQERDKRVDEPAEAGETGPLLAHRMCVVAQLMSRVGDTRAADYFERAIAANPAEGGYELWYGHYLAGVRGPGAPLTERAEPHLHRAIAKVHARRESGAARADDAVTEEWAQRHLADLYQAVGVPVLPWKAFPYGNDGADAPGLFLTAGGRASLDTNDFVDVSDVRKFTSEAVFASSVERLDRDLTRDERRAIVRAPARYEVSARARVRQRILGSLDFGYRSLWIEKGQIVRFDQPNVFGDARVEEYGVTYKRSLDLYPAVDAMIEASYRRVERVGIVEYFPKQAEHIGLFEAKPVISRFLGPDKITLGMNFVYMDIPSIAGGTLDQRKRGRAITAFYFDYAIYRPLLLPRVSAGGIFLHRQDTRGWHFFGGVAFDEEVFGTRLVKRRDYYGGTSLLGIGRWDLTLQGTVFQSGVHDEAGFDLSSLSNAQYRTTLVPLFRIIDSDATPGLPEGARPAFVNLVFPIRHDLAVQGTRDFENVRAGVEVWSRLLLPWLRGTSVLASGGYAFQYFYQLDKGLHLARLDVGIGW
jgi:hypothetical protein